jgi:hypothetical protein
VALIKHQLGFIVKLLVFQLFAMPESMDFSSAENLCREFGSHAASVHSNAENQFMASIANETYHVKIINAYFYLHCVVNIIIVLQCI